MRKRISETVPYDKTKAAKELARERIGQPPGERVVVPKKGRNPKHKRNEDEM